MKPLPRLLTALVLAGLASPLAAQTPSPDTIWLEAGRGLPGTLPARIAPDSGPLIEVRSLSERLSNAIPRTGRMEMVVIPALFSDSPEPHFTRAEIADALFDPAGPSVTDYYSEVSRGIFTADGVVAPWVRTSVTLLEAAGDEGGHGFVGERIKDFIAEAILLADESIDFGRFDNDGPDGIPNSGDDNGVVDAVSIEFLEPAGSCPGGPGIWPHFSGVDVETNDRAPDGSPIRVGAYFTESTSGCDGVSIQTPGVVAHEFGHLIGLPDFYRPVEGILPSQRHWNIGCFGLMGAGAWGCGAGPTGADFGPTHLSAWSRIRLEWAEVVDGSNLRNEEIVLGDARLTGEVLRIPLDPRSDEYLLVEYRRQGGYDADLPGEGVLVYHVDNLWRQREVQAGEPIPYFHHLIEADGDFELRRVEAEGGNRGEAEDMFGHDGAPGRLPQAGDPSTVRHDGSASPVILHSIRVDGPAARIRLTTHPTPELVPHGSGDWTVFEPVTQQWLVFGGVGPYTVEIDSGNTIDGIETSVVGRSVTVTGTPQAAGMLEIPVTITDSRGAEGVGVLELLVADLELQPAALIRALRNDPLDGETRGYLDRSGNDNGRYDLGDVRAYLQRVGALGGN